MLNFLSRFWIEFPLCYALTVGGLITGYQRGGVPPNTRLWRAIRAGLPVMIGILLLWGWIVGLIESGLDARSPAGLTMLLGIMFILSASALVGATLARRSPANAPARGAVLLDEAPPDPATVPPDVITLAGHPVAKLDETKHFKIIGTTGTGKTTAIREILAKALSRGDRAVITDPDAGYLKRFYDPDRGDVILNPFDPRSARWDLFAELSLPQDADQLARSFIADQNGQDRIWRGFARTYVSSILRQFHRLQEHDLGSLHQLLVAGTEEDLRDLLQGTPALRFLGAKEGGKFLESVQSVTNQHLGSLEYLARQSEGNLLSVRRWIREGRGVLFLPYSANEIASLSNLISAWMRLAIFETMNCAEGDQRLWFIIDELDALGVIDGLKDALTRVRKFGGRCVLGFQSIAQVRDAFGDAQAQSIVENCANTAILRSSASERGGTAEFASRLIGQRQIIRQQHSTSRAPGQLFRKTHTLSDQLFTEDAVMASEIEQLPDLSGFLKLASQPHWRRIRFVRSPE